MPPARPRSLLNDANDFIEAIVTADPEPPDWLTDEAPPDWWPRHRSWQRAGIRTRVNTFLGRLWHATDILPGSLADDLFDLLRESAPRHRSTYAVAARLLRGPLADDVEAAIAAWSGDTPENAS